MNFPEYVKTSLSEFYEKLRPIYMEWNAGKTDDCLSYYFAHKPRFDAMQSIISGRGKNAEIAEFGSFLPYTSYGLDAKHVDCYDILFKTYDIDNFSKDIYSFNGLNLNYEIPDKQYDLVIVSEVIEHLPCNLFELEDRLISTVKNGGYILVTYPMHGYNAQDYEKDYGDHESFRHEHLREFNDSTYGMFFKRVEKVVESEVVYPAYGRIKLVLYRKA